MLLLLRELLLLPVLLLLRELLLQLPLLLPVLLLPPELLHLLKHSLQELSGKETQPKALLTIFSFFESSFEFE